MSPKNIDEDKLIKYWIESSDEDYETMIIMFRNKRYNWSLFIGHLMIEKLLKALYVKTNNDYPPYIHNLVSLAEKCGLELTDDQNYFHLLLLLILMQGMMIIRKVSIGNAQKNLPLSGSNN